MADTNQIVEQLSALTVLEIADLVKKLEEKWGVSAAAPVAVATSPAGGAGGAAAPAVEEQTAFDVILKEIGPNKISVIKEVRAVTNLLADEVTPGKPNDASGQAQLAYLTAAVDAALAGEVAALVTAPISKEWIARAGFAFPGHTEYLAARAGVSEFAMMLAGPQLRVTVATTHVPLKDIPRLLTVDGIASTIWLTIGKSSEVSRYCPTPYMKVLRPRSTRFRPWAITVTPGS